MISPRHPTLHVVHCIDAEGPLTEDLEATFDRVNDAFNLSLAPSAATLARLQHQKLPLDGREAEVARMLAPELLRYNNSWDEIDAMLDEAMSPTFRNAMTDDAGEGWVYSWHCVDHAGYASNPRHKDTEWGSVFHHYKRRVAQGRDEINWHFHPLSFSRDPLQCATSYVNSYDVLMQVLCRRVIDQRWFPRVNRPGFHSERPDSHAYLEQWIPYDYANQADHTDTLQPDLTGGRFGDWRRAPHSWGGYHPHHDDYQSPGDCRRWIFRCMNVGTRVRTLTPAHVDEAFTEAAESGSAILAFADHDYRDIRPDVNQVREMLADARARHKGISLRFSGALEAARAHTEAKKDPLKLSIAVEGSVLTAKVVAGALFGPQPFLAFKTKSGTYHHDNFDVQTPGQHYTYILDLQTIMPQELAAIGVASAGRDGSEDVEIIEGL